MKNQQKPPIKTQAEADRVRASLVARLQGYLHLDEEEAGRRVDGLNNSGLLIGCDPNDPAIQEAIAGFLSIPSSNYAHLK